MHSMKSLVSAVFCSAALLVSTQSAQAETLKPFVLAQKANGEPAAVVAEVRQKLADAGFQIAGEYSPYPAATIIAVTSDALQRAVTQSEFGGFGAVQRVSVTQAGDAVQVAYTDPVYMSHAYRMSGNLTPVADALKQALGSQQTFGPDKGLTPKDLRKYHYKFLMPYFDDRIELAAYGNQQAAVEKVETALAAGKGGASKVYRVDLPGGKETVFGVAMTTKCSGDSYIMERIDFKPVRSTGHLPYEMLVRDGKVYTLPAEFRIAINFPDLSMMGSNSFASIMCAPDAIKNALIEAAGGSVSKGGLF